MANREVVGIVTKINHPDAKVKRAESWLRLAGCKKIFLWISKPGKGWRKSWNISGRTAM